MVSGAVRVGEVAGAVSQNRVNSDDVETRPSDEAARMRSEMSGEFRGGEQEPHTCGKLNRRAAITLIQGGGAFSSTCTGSVSTNRH